MYATVCPQAEKPHSENSGAETTNDFSRGKQFMTNNREAAADMRLNRPALTGGTQARPSVLATNNGV